MIHLLIFYYYLNGSYQLNGNHIILQMTKKRKAFLDEFSSGRVIEKTPTKQRKVDGDKKSNDKCYLNIRESFISSRFIYNYTHV